VQELNFLIKKIKKYFGLNILLNSKEKIFYDTIFNFVWGIPRQLDQVKSRPP